MASEPRIIEGHQFDVPLIVDGVVGAEPQSYIAERPYELTKFEFAILRRASTMETWVVLVVGATLGLVIAIVGKALAALIEKKTPTLETWEMWGVGAGIAASLILLVCRKAGDRERAQLVKVVDGHFETNRPRRVHITSRESL